MSEPEIDPTNIRPGPIRSKELSAELLDQIEAIYEVIGPYLGTTLEQFEISFMRDDSPEVEVILWNVITGAWIKYHDNYLFDEMLPDDEEKKLIRALLAISTGADDPEKLGVDPEIARGLIECWNEITD